MLIYVGIYIAQVSVEGSVDLLFKNIGRKLFKYNLYRQLQFHTYYVQILLM